VAQPQQCCRCAPPLHPPAVLKQRPWGSGGPPRRTARIDCAALALRHGVRHGMMPPVPAWRDAIVRSAQTSPVALGRSVMRVRRDVIARAAIASRRRCALGLCHVRVKIASIPFDTGRSCWVDPLGPHKAGTLCQNMRIGPDGCNDT
jgi:hypothetical protein